MRKTEHLKNQLKIMITEDQFNKLVELIKEEKKTKSYPIRDIIEYYYGQSYRMIEHP